MKRWTLILLTLFSILLSFQKDTILGDDSAINSSAIEQPADYLMPVSHSIDFPMESPLSYTHVSSVVLSSTYCRTLGKYRFNTNLPVVCDNASRIKRNTIYSWQEELLNYHYFSYAADYYVFEQRRILI